MLAGRYIDFKVMFNQFFERPVAVLQLQCRENEIDQVRDNEDLATSDCACNFLKARISTSAREDCKIRSEQCHLGRKNSIWLVRRRGCAGAEGRPLDNRSRVSSPGIWPPCTEHDEVHHQPRTSSPA